MHAYPPKRDAASVAPLHVRVCLLPLKLSRMPLIALFLSHLAGPTGAGERILPPTSPTLTLGEEVTLGRPLPVRFRMIS